MEQFLLLLLCLLLLLLLFCLFGIIQCKGNYIEATQTVVHTLCSNQASWIQTVFYGMYLAISLQLRVRLW